jgi:Zn-dependent protease
VRISLLWVGAGTKFEGAYRSGRDQARVALAGPAASCAFAAVLLTIALMPIPRPVQLGIFGLAILNLAIGIFSLLPVYPLDGHKLLVGLLWRRSRSEGQAKAILRRAGGVWLAVEGIACVVLVIEKPALGGIVLASGALLLLQRRLSARRRQLPRRASFRATQMARSR